ncbi:MAG: hypothetical protein UU29_C0020G0005 [Candidatus Daviesbacteria bacterium GW2011_GWA2_40_9]|uniref:Uncharacterized protein n=1 Tax=Candidatus Daviesbacteria bacterium GW2011_GWA2_40_9 TaxID=1618424 RepID=A0A0G0TYL5_9BACT|nr:MAG: hypothetical protein UU29_C0020G0005 [Candidatus Daviesbacteria bacterium GW2011_GWA2_40_9]
MSTLIEAGLVHPSEVDRANNNPEGIRNTKPLLIALPLMLEYFPINTFL